MRIGAHATVAFGRQIAKLFDESAVLVEELFGLVAVQPLLHDVEMLRLFLHVEHGHLMGSPEVFNLVAVDFLGAGPALGAAENDHGPAGPVGLAVGTGFVLDGADLLDALVDSFGHRLMHEFGIFTFDHVRVPAVANDEGVQLFGRDAGEDGGVRDLIAVEMEDGENGAIADGIEELVGVP